MSTVIVAAESPRHASVHGNGRMLLCHAQSLF
jgi:hypothetical protein